MLEMKLVWSAWISSGRDESVGEQKKAGGRGREGPQPLRQRTPTAQGQAEALLAIAPLSTGAVEIIWRTVYRQSSPSFKNALETTEELDYTEALEYYGLRFRPDSTRGPAAAGA